MAEGPVHRRWGRLALAAGLLLLALGGWQMGSAAYLHAKAWLAQVLLAEAWAATLADGTPHKPWPWADTAPVARLQVPALGVDQIVLAGVSGRSLAFGPGHLDGTPHAPARAATACCPGTAIPISDFSKTSRQARGCAFKRRTANGKPIASAAVR